MPALGFNAFRCALLSWRINVLSINCHKSSFRKALTLIESIIVLAVIFTLAALLLAALSAARHAARRTQCANNLRQLGIALNHYTDLHGVFPSGAGGIAQSSFVSLLTELDQVNIYNSVNWSRHLSSMENFTLKKTSLSVLLCPSDSLATPVSTSYAGNVGTKYSFYTNKQNGIFSVPRTDLTVFTDAPRVRLSSVTDGLSTTVAFAEWVLGDRASHERRRQLYRPADYNAHVPTQHFERMCLSLNDMTVYETSPYAKGQTWYIGQWLYSLYDHHLPIDSPACYLSASNNREISGSATANSTHGKGTHALFCDGHTAWLNAGLDRDVWRSLGTRNGGEVISTSFD